MLQRLHLAFTSSRRCFALAVGAHTLRVWLLEEGLDPDSTGAEIAYALEMDTGRMGIVGMTFLDESRLVVTHGDGCVQCWELTPTGDHSDPSTQSEHGEALPERRHDLEAVGLFRRSGEDPVERASPSIRATLRWELELGSRLESCKFTSTDWGSRCVLGATDGRVFLVDLAPGFTPRATLLGAHNTSVILAELAHDGSRLATASRDRKLGVWRPDELVAPRGEGGAWRVLDESGGEVWAMSLSPSSRYLVSGGIDNGIYFWDLKAERALRAESHDHEGWIASLAWSEDERVIASASWDKTIGLFQAGDLKPLYCFEYHKDYVSQVMFVPGTNLLVSASYDKTVAVWDWRNAELIKVLSGHEDWIQTLMWLGDGMFCSASSDRTVRVWSTSSMTEVAVLGEGSADDWMSASLGSSFGLGGLSSLSERSSGFGARRRVRGSELSGPADEVLASLAEVDHHELGDDVSSFIEDEVMVLAALASERASSVRVEVEPVEEEPFEVPKIGPRPVMFGDEISDVDDSLEDADDVFDASLQDSQGDEVSNAASVSEDALLIEKALERLSFASDAEDDDDQVSESEAHDDAEEEHFAPGSAYSFGSPSLNGPDPGTTLHGDPTKEFSLADVVKNLSKMNEPGEDEPVASDEPAGEPADEPAEDVEGSLSLEGAPEDAPASEPALEGADVEAAGEHEPSLGEGGAGEAAEDELDTPEDASDEAASEEPAAEAELEEESEEAIEVTAEDIQSSEVAGAVESEDLKQPRLPRPPSLPDVSASGDVLRPEVLSEAPDASELGEASVASDDASEDEPEEVQEDAPDEAPEEVEGAREELEEVAEDAGEEVADGLDDLGVSLMFDDPLIEELEEVDSVALEESEGAMMSRPSSGTHISPPQALQARYEVDGLGDRISSSVEDDSVIESSLATIDPDEASEPQSWVGGDGPSSMSEPMSEASEVASREEPSEEPSEEPVEEPVEEPTAAEPVAEDPAASAAAPTPSEEQREAEESETAQRAVEQFGQLAGAESSSAVEEIATEMSGWAAMGSRFQMQASKAEPASVVTDLDNVDLMNLGAPKIEGAELSMGQAPSEALQGPRDAFMLERETTRRFQEPASLGGSFDPTVPDETDSSRPRQATREQVRAKLKKRIASGKLSRLKSNLDTEFEEGVPPTGAQVAEVSLEDIVAAPLEVSPLLAASAPALEGIKRSAPSFVSATSIERVATAELLSGWESESEIQILPDLTISEDQGDATVPEPTRRSELDRLPDVALNGASASEIDIAPSIALNTQADEHGRTESERIEFEPTEAEPPPLDSRPSVGGESTQRPRGADTVEGTSRKQPSREELDAAFATMSPAEKLAARNSEPTPTPFPPTIARAELGGGNSSQTGSPMAKFLSPEEVAERSRPGLNDLDVHGTVMGFGSPFMPSQDSSSMPKGMPGNELEKGRELFDVTVAEIWQLRLGQRRAAMKIFKKRSTVTRPFRSWERLEPEVGEVYGLSPGGEVSYFAVCGARNRVDIWAASERAFSLESDRSATLQALTVSPDGRVVIAGDEDGVIHLWLLPAEPIEDRKASIGRAVMGGHTGPISSIALSSTGKMMVTGSLDGTARLWDMVNGSCVAVLTRHRGPVTGVTFTSKGPVTISRDGSLRLWDKRGVLLSEADGLGDLSSICSRKGKVYVGNGKGEVHAFQRGEVSKVLEVDGPIVSMAMSVEDVGVIGTRKGIVHVFEWGKTETLQTLQVGEDVSSVGATDKELLVGTVTGAVEVYRQP